MMLDTPGDEQISGQIVARKLSSSRIEFGWLPSGSDDDDRVLPSPRFFPANPTVDKWLSSGSVAVAGSEIGHIEARRLHDGRTEFAFAPADQIERVYPDVRYFPPDARVGRWLHSSAITITPGPDDGGDTMEAPDEDELGTTTQPSPEPPTTPPTTVTGYRAVSAGGAHTCGLRTSGAIECWGNNGNGQTNAPAGTFTAVSAGNSYTCGLRESGAIECWGSNGNGQATDRAGRFTAVSAGQAHTCAIRTSGAIECWGDDAHGQANNRAGRFTAVSAGGHHTCGLRESGAIECWGNNVIGQANDRAGSYTAVSASSLNTCAIRSSGAIECWGGFRSIPAGSYRAVSTGEYHICGLRENGAITCWGENSDGQADAPTGSYTAVSAGARHTCGLRTTGEIECWGSNSAGQTNVPSAADGDGSEPERLINEAVPTGTVNIEGEDGDELAGDGGDQPTPEPRVETSTMYPSPTDPLPPRVPVSSEITGIGYIIARLGTDGRIEFGWQGISGAGYFPSARYFPTTVTHNRWLRSATIEAAGGRIEARRLSDGRIEFALTPTGWERSKRILPTSRYFPTDAQVGRWLRSTGIDDTDYISDLVVGELTGEENEFIRWGTDAAYTAVSGICGIRDTGALECAGTRGAPAGSFTAGSFTAVSDAADYTCAIRTSGAIECWGSNTVTQILVDTTGEGHGETRTVTLGRTDAPAGRFTAVSAGDSHACAIRESGAIECWGWNEEGQTDAPTGSFTAVSAGLHHTCAIRSSNGAIECWGANSANYGQTAAPAGTFTTVSTGWWHGCGLRTNGAIECWGGNYDGQGEYVGQSVAPSGSFTAVSAGSHHTCGLRSSGTIECWGDNDYGKSAAPAGSYRAVSAGDDRTCAIRESGAITCWGHAYSELYAPAR